MDAETSLRRFARMPFIDHKVPDDFRRALIANYANWADLEKKLGQNVKYPWEKEEAPGPDAERLGKSGVTGWLRMFSPFGAFHANRSQEDISTCGV